MSLAGGTNLAEATRCEDAPGRLFGVPSMNGDLEVKVLRGVGRSDPSEPQGCERERTAERSG
jgi:hypothetical protein